MMLGEIKELMLCFGWTTAYTLSTQSPLRDQKKKSSNQDYIWSGFGSLKCSSLKLLEAF